MSYLDFDFPHTRFFESDLRELIKQIFVMNDLVTNFVSINAIKYADPIQWDITKSYEKNTVVIDGNSGVAYISVRPVPPGIGLTREQYWTKVFDLSIFIVKAGANFANSFESEPTTTATLSTPNGNWVVWDSYLYQALTDIHPGDRYVPGGNIRRATVEDFYNILKSIIDNEIHEREAGDDALEVALNEETELRIEGDAALHNEIVEGDAALHNEVVEESTARENADTSLQNNIDGEEAARIAADNELQSRIDAVAEQNRVYKNIAEMVADASLSIGKCAICCEPYESKWEITSAVEEDLVNRRLNNGLNAKLLNNVPINIGALKRYSTNDDISADIAFLISNNYNDITIPKGIYRCSVTITANTKLRGMGLALTSLLPVNHGTCLSLDGDQIYISDLSIYDSAPYNGYGIVVNQSLGCSNSHFENIHIENCREGFFVRSTMIWNEFTNCDFIGCMDTGFIVTSPEAFFNNNAFYSCKFNNNVNNGITIDVTEVHDYANVFYSCNIEYNCIDRFGITHVSDNAVKNTGFTSFIGCYFEGNGSSNTDATILNYDLLNLQGCVFVQDRILVNNTAPSITNFIGCKQYQCAGYVTSPTNNVNTLGNNFTIS